MTQFTASQGNEQYQDDIDMESIQICVICKRKGKEHWALDMDNYVGVSNCLNKIVCEPCHQSHGCGDSC